MHGGHTRSSTPPIHTDIVLSVYSEYQDLFLVPITVATATAEGIRRVGDALQTTGGDKAMQLRIAEQYIEEFGRLAKTGNTFVVPANLSDIASMIALATGIVKKDVV